MSIKILLLSIFIFTIIYPPFFSPIIPRKLKTISSKIFFYLPNIAAGILTVILLIINISIASKLLVVLWKIILVITTRYSIYNRKKCLKYEVLTVLLGIYAFLNVYMDIFTKYSLSLLIPIICGILLSIFLKLFYYKFKFVNKF